MPRQQDIEPSTFERTSHLAEGDIAPEPRSILDEPDIARDPAVAAIARKLAEEAGNWRAASGGEADLEPEDDPTGHA